MVDQPPWMRRRSRLAAIGIPLLLIAGAALRLWGIRRDLPYLYHPDEPLGVSVALRMMKSADANPHFFGYGSFFFYLNAAAYAAYYALGRAVGLFHSPDDVPNLPVLALGVPRTAMPSEVIALRLVTVAASLCCMIVAHRLGARL